MVRYRDDSLTIIDNDDKDYIYVEALCQELRLFKGENPLNIEAGIDYLKVFNGEAFLKPLVEEVCEKYSDYFDGIEVGEATEEEEVLYLPIHIKTKNSGVVSTNLEIKL